MTRTARLTVALLIAVAAILAGAFLTAPVPAPAQPTVPGVPAPSDGGGDAVPVDSEGDQGAVRSDPADGADSDTDRAVPATDSDTDRAVSATGDDQDGTDPDALPADAPRVCVILDMGAAACESFVHPAPGEVSVAVIYSDDDERAIVETIAYDEHGPIDYVDFWEGETTPSE